MQTNTTGISRRNFIGGMAGAGALAALGLAGCAPKAQGEATGDTKKADGAAEGQNAAADWLGTAPEIAESDIKETKECDLLIVGAGNGGMAAAAYAADKGVDFMICEKGETVGATRHWFAAVDTPPFTSQGVTVDRQRLMGEIVRYSQGNCDQRLIRMWMDESADMFAFVDGIMTAAGARVIADEYEMPGGMGGTPYYTPPFEHHYGDEKGGRDIEERNKLFEQHIQKAGHEVMYKHALAKLVREGDGTGSVTGAIFETGGGYVQINAKKGVLLTTGGYPANPAMVQALSPVTAQSVTALGYNQNDTGDGIKAALWAGAAKDLTSATMIFDRGLVAPGTKAGYTEESIKAGDPQFPSNGQFNPGTQPFLKVNLNGERFANESADYDYLPHAAAQQPGGVYISVWDSNFGDDVQRFHTLGCSAGTRMGVLGVKKEDGTYDLDKYFQKQLDDGRLQKADTIEELADKLGFEGDAKKNFLAEVERYNELFDMQQDPDFGKEAYRLSALRKPPYYGATLGGTLLTTIDGVRINHDCQAIDTEGNPIEGLYAAGDCSGSVFSGCYPDQLHGFACGRTMTEAIHVVKQMATA
ncbi:MAG TPA: FAD-binding protein [Candidatus Gordonibacter avicola]|nr:FAD-binding protein [Candidatus Gordonibacter avicola]